MRGVIDDLNFAGFTFDKAWFAPHMNFRFPTHGKVVVNGIELEIRHALEPWHVLGEEGGGGGTVRFVDSSVERLQVKVTGMVGERHSVACNEGGRLSPTTGVEGEYVAGVRFRAWAPPTSCTRPSRPTGLIPELMDCRSNRAIGGCTTTSPNPGVSRNHENHAGQRARGRGAEIGPVRACSGHERKVYAEGPGSTRTFCGRWICGGFNSRLAHQGIRHGNLTTPTFLPLQPIEYVICSKCARPPMEWLDEVGDRRRSSAIAQRVSCDCRPDCNGRRCRLVGEGVLWGRYRLRS